MVVLRCPSRQWGDHRRGFLHQTECQPERSPMRRGSPSTSPCPTAAAIAKLLDTRPELFKASKSGCDVSIGPNRFVGDLKRYTHHRNHRGDIGRYRIDGRRPRLAPQIRSSLFWCRRARKALWLAPRGAPQAGKRPLHNRLMRNTAPPAADITITIGATSPCRR